MTLKCWTREHFTETHYNIAQGIVIFQRSLCHCQRPSATREQEHVFFPRRFSPACAVTGSRYSAVHRHWCQVSSQAIFNRPNRQQPDGSRSEL